MGIKQANQQDHLEGFIYRLNEYNDNFPGDEETYDSLRELEDDVLTKRLNLTKKELQAWRKYQDSFQTMTTDQQRNILVLCKALVVLKSLVNIYKESKDAKILKKAQDIILKIKALDSKEHVFMSIRNELVLHLKSAKQKAVKRVLKRVSGDLTSTREIAYASQSIMVMMGLINTTDIQEMSDVLEGAAYREFKNLVNDFKNSEGHGDYEIIKQVGASKITGARSIQLHIKVAQAVKLLGGNQHITASEATNLATSLADIANDTSRSVSEKIRDRNLLIDEELASVQEEFEQGDMTDEEREAKLDSIKVIKAMAEAEILIAPREEQTEIGKKLGLTQEQEDAMTSEGKTIISAGAGSGKTRVLSAKVANLLNNPKYDDVSPFNIMAVSFSRKSAKDLQDKIKLHAGDKIPSIDVTALGKTTHAIAIEFINRFDPEATKAIVADKFMQDKLVQQAIKLASNTESGELTPEPDTFFGKKTESLGGNNKQVDMRILNLLTSSQRWLEGRGYERGRTVQLQQIAKNYLATSEVSPSEIELVNEILDFNRGWRAKLKAFEGNEAKAKKYTFPSYRGAVKTASLKSTWWGIQELAEADEKIPSVKACKLFITKAKSQMMTPQQAFDKVKASGNEYIIKAKIYGAYQYLLKKEGRMDFDDVLIKGVQVLNNATNLKQVQKQYKHIIVDEAQDLNPVQHAFFGLIAGTHTSGGRNQPPQELPPEEQEMEGKSFTLVGDENQSIYGFRGATQKEFSSKAGDFTLKQIGINFRSGENIVNAANKLVEADSEDSLGLQCVASFKDQKDTIKHEIHDNVGKASRDVADHIKAMTNPENEFTSDSPSDFGIACRTNAEIVPYALALLEKGVPFKSGVNPFAHRSTKAIIRILGFCTNDPSLQMSALYNFHKDLEMPISRFDGFMQNCKELLTDKVSDARTLAESVKTALVHWAKGNLENEGLVDFLDGQGEEDRDRVNRIYFYLDMLLGLRQVGERTPVEAFDVALGYKPYTSGGREKFIANPDNGKKLHEILGSYVNKSDTSSLSALGGEQDIDEEVEGEGADQEGMSPSEQEEWNLAPLPALRQMFLKADQSEGGFFEIFEKISEMKRNADSQGLVKDDDDVVVLDTVHGWKGLEVKNLYVPMVEGTFPSSRSTFDPLIHESQEEADKESLEQEKKLAYVAITRGMSNVNILSYKTSTAGKEVEPSQFITQMGICDITQKTASQKRLATALDILSEYSAPEDDDMTDAEFEEATKGL